MSLPLKNKRLWDYKSFQDLTNNLVYMKRTDHSFSILLWTQVNIICLYTNATKYSFSFEIKSEKLLKKVKGTKFVFHKNKIPNKATFLRQLKTQIDAIIPIIQQEGYKLTFEPEITLYDLEMIEEDYNLNKEKSNTQKESKTLVNRVLIYHEIMTQNLLDQPSRKNRKYLIEINTIDIKEAQLFPEEDKYFTNIDFKAEATPNVYFSGIIVLSIKKTFSYKGFDFKISFECQNTIKSIAHIARQYYNYYKETKREEALAFSTKLLKVVKNPNLGNGLSKEEAIKKSQCKKCNSSSAMFVVTLGMIDIKTKMSSLQAFPLYPEDIVTYKDILKVSCEECGNIITENKQALESSIRRENKKLIENWENPETGVPLLDEQTERDVTLKYSTMELETEFDLTDPYSPQLLFSKITKVGKVVGWLDSRTKKYKSFL